MILLDRMNPEAKEKLLQTISERIERAVQNNENLTWDSLLSRRQFSNIASGRAYKGSLNILMLALTAFAEADGDPRFISFLQLKDLSKDRGFIRKGSKLTPIWRPILKKSDPEEDEAETTDKQFLMGYRMSYVANVRQTNLIELGIIPEKWIEANSDSKPISSVIDWCSRIDFKTEHSDIPYYSPGRDVIGMPPFEAFHNNFGHAEALCHELAHWTGAKHRLARPFGMDHDAYSDEELVACIGSTLLLNHLGVSLSDNRIERQASYIKGWLKTPAGRAESLITAAAHASRAVDYLIELAEANSLAVMGTHSK